MNLGLTDKIALVTGGSRTIGYAIAERLGLEGARIAICGRNSERLEAARAKLESQGIVVLARAADVGSPGEVKALLEAIEQRFGGLDLLVNVPGGTVRPGSFSQVPPEEWRLGLEVNVLSVVSVSQLALPYLKARPWGRIVNLGAFYMAAGTPNLLTRFAENALAKNAVAVLTKVMADELAPSITVNCIAPGPVGEDHPMRPETASYPVPRAAAPEEIAALAAFLCSSHASYLTGLTIPLDGGLDRRVL
jgi:NAD(P)-dependent dehydrogenase (short-subunit alcohol dehydrogenase family)